jgi:hypothetical protein
LFERVFHPYTRWEDWGCEMYRPQAVTENDMEAAAEVLRNPSLCRVAMERAVREWPFATEHNLSDRTHNRRPWLGRAAVCIATGLPERVTREVWVRLAPSDQERANRDADAVINAWEASRSLILQPA